MRTSVLLLLLGGLLLFSGGVGVAATNEAELREWKEMRNTFALKQALMDVNAHMAFLQFLRDEFGEESRLKWGVPVAEQLPYQPVAVIQLALRTQTPVGWICPREKAEDSYDFHKYIDWIRLSVTSLQAFTMKDPKGEAMRKDCLQAFEDVLAENGRFQEMQRKQEKAQ